MTESLRWLRLSEGALQRDELSPLLGDRRAQTNVIVARCEYVLGHWDKALVSAHSALDLAADESQLWITAQAHAISAMVHAGRGNFDVADRHIKRGNQIAAVVPTVDAVGMTTCARAALAEVKGDSEAVIAELAVLTRGGGDHLPGSHSLFFWPTLVAARLDRGDRAGAESELAALIDSARRRCLDFRMQIHWLNARIAGLDGDSTRADVEYAAAVESETTDQLVLDRAAMRRDYGMFLRANRRRRAATEQFAIARRVLSDAGAFPYLRAVDSTITGGAGIPESADPDSALSILTDRERDVVVLAADGQTNKEIAAGLYVSVKAVEYHLGNAYAKLGVHSRRDLKGVVHRK
ncbi:helix-turn-helix transcriptional regulator [Gordonia insulae]|uniref:HTH-type transcriptional regulator n=1 Tax=Gordonia insulae TaxID=2420509 RepID=A0A3G8JHS1_9ACTN|nr:helix-turn-helix transcriptional regulator [Gordonia insulae]AZG44564.1 Putative HTH-type transcriptional regulator [Gordonia insulae]